VANTSTFSIISFVKIKVESDVIEIMYVPTEHKVVDVLTKTL